MKLRITVVVLAVVTLAGCQQAKSHDKSGYNGFDLVDTTGHIRRPTDYRDHYQALGTYMVLDPKGDQMHFTYASPGAAEYYRNTDSLRMELCW